MTAAVPVRIHPFDEARPVRVVFGPGRITAAGAEADRLGLTKVMLIADASAPGGDTLVDSLGDRVALRRDEVAQHVPLELAERAR
jgi:maleylacetate reductase